MNKEQPILIVGIDRSTNEKDNSAAVLNLYYNGVNHIIYETEDKEQVEAFDEISRIERKKQQSLLRLDEIENANPSEALECFKEIEERCKNDYEDCIVWYDYKKELYTIKQTLLKSKEQERVLEIIKEKEVNLGMLKTCKTVEQYNAGCRIFERNELTQEEFDLLKRYSNNE